MTKIKAELRKPSPKIIAIAARIIRAGGLVVYPTDTVYGLGADARSDAAVAKVFRAKKRRGELPIPVGVSSFKMAEKFAVFSPLAERVFRELMPGPLTIVLRAKKDGVSKLLLGGTGKIGLRIPNHPVALKLIELVKGPVTATSANISGKPSPLAAKEALDQLGEVVDLVIDAGKSKLGKPSTVVDMSSIEPKILREGPTRIFELKRLLKKK